MNSWEKFITSIQYRFHQSTSSTFQNLYRASNKEHESNKMICLNEWWIIEILLYNEKLRLKAIKKLKTRNLKDEDSEDKDSEDENSKDNEDDIDMKRNQKVDQNEHDYNKFYKWKILLENELDFEYLDDENQIKDELTAWRNKKLYKIKE